jgi:hypothetical protein
MSQDNHATENRVVEHFYDRLDGTQISGVARRSQCIEGPGCGLFTEIDHEVWDCEHCDETLDLFVGSFASAQNSDTESDCADANDGRTLKEKINDDMVVSREDADA